MSTPSLPPAWQLYLKDHRISTFKNWPFLEGCACTPERMAAAGFIHCPTENEPDLAQCFFCFKELEGWEPDDDPMQRKPTISRKNLKKLQRKSAVPLSSWLPRSDAVPTVTAPQGHTHILSKAQPSALPAFLWGLLTVP
ncbi:baculoviral IAP repeat-containing protein 5 isoform X2 [Eubalaena glacialis]|uniref:baculoviral IAP repeat-containing protein 5 isoform X2 n=1 Tax=Eubalaena glacialis TaxID=27606 RepID=UPI002A5AE83B|nr:baculoviral IAP repeat-containing protein 5 isoform X2 [Eubalaena glacialis]